MNNISLSEINNKLNHIINKIDSLETKINYIEKKTEKIDHHLNFGAQVYNAIKTPLNFFTDKVNAYIGSNVRKLPELNYLENNIENNIENNDNIENINELDINDID